MSSAILAVALVATLGRGEEQRHDALGIALEPPSRYEAFPVQPNEKWIVLSFTREASARQGGQSTLRVLRIPRMADPEPLPVPPPINCFERYLGLEWKAWKIDAEREAAPLAGRACREFDLRLSGISSGLVRGWAFTHEDFDVTWALLGMCLSDDYDKEVELWRKCAEQVQLYTPTVSKEMVKWTRFYEKNPGFRNPAARLAVRARLVEGWEAEDTENYLFITSSKKDSLVAHFQKRLEGIRRAYVELFPPAATFDAVSTVRVCASQEEYHRYGGQERTAGYWNPRTEELVLFVFENDENDRNSGKENSRSVLFHEGFHQYIHYAVGELAPHSWFNEGYGDYFGGAQFTVHGKVGRIEPHPWRIFTIKGAIYKQSHAPWSQMIRMSQADYYEPEKVAIHYSMGWSMIYFLNQAKEAKRNPLWSRILPVYFETLKAAHARERSRIEAEGLSGSHEALEKGHETAREAAVSAAFNDVDLQALQAAWRGYILALKPAK